MRIKIKRNRALCVTMVFLMMLITFAPIAVYAVNDPPGFTVGQEFTTSSGSADNTFTYRLKPLKPDNPMPPGSTAEGYTFTLTGNDSKYIGPLHYIEMDIYKYELYQVINSEKPGYTYDKRVYMIEMYAAAEQGDKFIVFNSDGTKSSTIQFKNEYRSPRLMVDPPVKKTVTGNPDKDSRFEFKLTAQNASQPMPEGSVNGVKTIYITGSGEGEFGDWYYTEAGTYRYTVQEVNTGESGYAYDKTVYTITDTVSDRNGTLGLSRVITNDRNEQVSLIAYTNEYNSNPAENGKGILPRTWDDMNIPLFVALLVICGAFAIGLIVLLGKNKRRKNGKTCCQASTDDL